MKFSLSQPRDTTNGLVGPMKICPGSQDRYIMEAMVVGILPALAVYWLCSFAMPMMTIFFWLKEPIWILLLVYLSMGVLHEICHLLVSPKMGLTNNTVAGLDLKIMCPFVNVTSPISKTFFIAHALAPFVLLTGASLALAFQLSDSFLKGWFASVAIANAHACGADILMVIRAVMKMGPNDYSQCGYYGGLAKQP